MFTSRAHDRSSDVYAAAERFVRSGMKGMDGHDSAQQPFMLPELECKGEVGAKTEEADAFLERVRLPPALQRVYRVIGNAQSEYIFRGWILMSLQKVCDAYERMKENGQSRMVDFAYIYAGMGHVVVCSYDPELARIYYRGDGGANGWERSDHFNRACKYVPRIDDSYDISDWFERVERWEETCDPFSLPLVK